MQVPHADHRLFPLVCHATQMTPHHGPETATDTADRASLAALLICLARETAAIPPDAPVWRFPVAQGWLELRPGRVLYSGLPPLTDLLHQTPAGPRRIGMAEALALLLAQLCTDHPVTGPALADRIRDSRARIAAVVAARGGEGPDPLDFLAAEQAVIFGHWMHPAPKALGGIGAAEERQMTPDWRGAFRLRWLSVASDLLETGGPADALRDLPGCGADPGPGRALLPVHPLAWDRLCRRADVAALRAQGAIRDLGAHGPLWHATSSVRTLWSPDSPWMVKVSLPVTITNSQRVNKRHELLTGALMAPWLAAMQGRFGTLRFVTDPAWATLRLPGHDESGFELILRDNPYRAARGGSVMQVAALVAPGLPGRTGLLQRAMAGHDPARWFGACLDVMLAPLLRLYDATGIAFEAHQQNVLLDLSQGLPCRADLRDNQGFYIAEDAASPAMRAIPHLVYPRRDAEDALGYTLLVNSLFGLIHRMDSDGLLPEGAALALLAARLGVLADELPGAGGQLATRWLTDVGLPAKGNLLTQLGGVDELLIPGERAPMIAVANPLPGIAGQRLRDVA